MDNLFLEASRRQLRFAAEKGFINTEDLWSLSLKALDALAVRIDENIKPERKSFLENPDPKARVKQDEDNLRLEILKAVISIKQSENKESLAAAAKRQQKQFLTNLLEQKKIGAMESMSIEELQAQIAAIGD